MVSATYLTDSQLGQMRINTALFFMDICTRLVYTPPADGSGYNKPTYPAGASLRCLFDGTPSKDVLPGTDVPVTDATLILPLGLAMLPDDRVQITQIHGQALANPPTYAIVAGPVADYVSLRAGLRLVTE